MGRYFIAVALLAILLASGPARAQDRLKVDRFKVLASFSILADLVNNVGGNRVEVAALVGANGDAHVYSPSPADARKAAAAQVVFVNGLGFEGWLNRLVTASGTKAPVIVASKGVKPRAGGDGRLDPHAWQSVGNAKIYVTNIRDGLIKADPAGQAVYEANATAYLAKLDALDGEVRAAVAKIPESRRRVVTSHNAFGYFERAYGIAFSAPQGVASEAEPAAKDVAAIVSQIKQQKASAVFLENITDSRLVELIARETGAKIGGTLYSDALTDESGEAPTYIDLVRHNLKQLAGALDN